MPRLAPRTLLWTGIVLVVIGLLWSAIVSAVALRGLFTFSYTLYSLALQLGPGIVTVGSVLLAGSFVVAAVQGPRPAAGAQPGGVPPVQPPTAATAADPGSSGGAAPTLPQSPYGPR
ncbi:MAG TPA: hypothetical protein VGC67_15030 [Cellulomonas sp.]